MTPHETSEFENRLLVMQAELKTHIDSLQEELNLIVAEDGIDDMEGLASIESDNMHHSALLRQQRHELEEVEHALAKIKAGTYGICEKNGDVIPPERLRAEPHARYCIEHAREMRG